jgi:uncharacterized protein (DUF2132 family)
MPESALIKVQAYVSEFLLEEMSTVTGHENKDPMHGVTLEMILTRLVEKYGWEDMSRRIRINCFAKDPSIKSSLTFLRRTPWARKKVEDLYKQGL